MTYVTALLAMIFAFIHALKLYRRRVIPFTEHILATAGLVLTAVLGLPYMWSKPIARYKLFAYMVGWGASLVVLLLAVAHGERDR